MNTQLSLNLPDPASEPAARDWVVSEVELVYRTRAPKSTSCYIKRSEDSFDLLLSKWDKNKIEFVEQFKIVLLNRANRVLAISDISTGGITGTVADPRIILATALKMNATSIILCHNHPSGSLRPSNADELMTTKIKEAAKFMDILVMDHIILSPDGYFSFADEGLL